MPKQTIYVSPLSGVAGTVADAGVSHLITLINSEMQVDTPASIEPMRHLRLSMNDICDPTPGRTAPCVDHVQELIDFAQSWDREAPLLIHCWAGISRSTAAAFIVLCALNPELDERRVAQSLRQASPTAYPNRRLVALADELLNREGRMLAAVEAIGDGEIAAEGRVFTLDAQLAA
ncbi:protein tyrosine phosphatase [Methyloligella sp. 2.7D]|uniref:tyrosine phosphatase family protein n=1 Tax=unclassified Methyloligella TaxID=2625955 RepID=UPI00157C0978|nr:protein tyrosine phosphatase [Methyloligella sp. GL2]QKP78278.1 protein tyrosine phosphatase [Methyloligella sp. GL2]